MNIVVDTSALIAVLLGESSREQILHQTEGVDLIAPASLHWEVGNAFSAMFKRRRIDLETAVEAIGHYQKIPIRFVDAELAAVIRLCNRLDLYAYDAYMLEVAKRYHAPLLTLDGGLKEAARKLDVQLVGLDR